MLNKVIKTLLCVLLAAMLCVFSATAFAVDLDGDGIDDEPSVSEETAPEEPAASEPETEPPTEYTTAAETTTEAYTTQQTTEGTTAEQTYEGEPDTTKATEATEPQTRDQEQYAAVETVPEDSGGGFQLPTLDKTISTKDYSTSYLAGFVSWVCVIIGAIVVAVVLISTIAGGRRKRGRYE